jgi:WS/DGAT/MGAT family acyltransferase
LLDSIKLAGTAAKAAYDLLFMSDEPTTSLHDDIGTTKRAAWTKEMDVAQIKAIGQAHDATINDVLLAATAGVFHRTLESRGEDTTGLDLRCTVPVNLKPMDRRDESLGNYFGLAFVPIPVDDRDLDERIRTIRDRADTRKLGVQAYIMYQLLSIGGHLPDQVFDAILPMFEDNATAVVSNVPGPLESISLSGHEVEEIMFWNPQAIDQGLSVSIFTYNSTVQVGVSGDAKLIPDASEMTRAFEEEIETLVEKYAE